MLTQRTLGFLDFCWLTMMDPSSDGYQNMLDKICRNRRWYEVLGCLRKSIQFLLTQAINLQWSTYPRLPQGYFKLLCLKLISSREDDWWNNPMPKSQDLQHGGKPKDGNNYAFKCKYLNYHFLCVLCSHIEKGST